MAFLTGMRPNEQNALKWGNVDFVHRKIAVREGRVGKVEGLPKTQESIRDIAMLEPVYELLRTYRTEARLPNEYVFLNQHGRPIEITTLRRRIWYPACVPCMRSCLGVKVPRPGVRGAEGQGKRKGIVVRQCLKAAWNERAGRGTQTGYKVWYARGELARDSKALHPQLGRALYTGRLRTDGMTAYHGRPLRCPGTWRTTETS